MPEKKSDVLVDAWKKEPVHYSKDDSFARFVADMMGPLLPGDSRLPVSLVVLGDGAGNGPPADLRLRVLAGAGTVLSVRTSALGRLESAWRTVRRAAWFFLAAGLADAVVTHNVEGTAVLMALASAASLLYGGLAGLGIRPLRRRLRGALGEKRLDALGAVSLLERGGWIYLFLVRPLGLRPGDGLPRHGILAVASAEEIPDLEGVGRAVQAAGDYVPAEILFSGARPGQGGVLAREMTVHFDAPCPER
jgi:hypothetical protein